MFLRSPSPTPYAGFSPSGTTAPPDKEPLPTRRQTSIDRYPLKTRYGCGFLAVIELLEGESDLQVLGWCREGDTGRVGRAIEQRSEAEVQSHQILPRVQIRGDAAGTIEKPRHTSNS